MPSVGFRTALEAWIGGMLAYAIGFVGTFALEGGRPAADATLVTGQALGGDGAYTVGELRESGGPDALPTVVEFTGWRHHRAHFTSLEGIVRSGESSRSAVEVAADPGTLTYLVPVVLLFVAGYWLSARYLGPNAVVSAARGTYVAIGYVVPATATVFLLEWQLAIDTGTLVIRPEPGTAIALTGIVYPVVVGGFGGYLAHEIHADGSIGEQFG